MRKERRCFGTGAVLYAKRSSLWSTENKLVGEGSGRKRQIGGTWDMAWLGVAYVRTRYTIIGGWLCKTFQMNLVGFCRWTRGYFCLMCRGRVAPCVFSAMVREERLGSMVRHFFVLRHHQQLQGEGGDSPRTKKSSANIFILNGESLFFFVRSTSVIIVAGTLTAV